MPHASSRPATARPLGDGDLGLWVAFDDRHHAKALPGARWDPHLKAWRVRAQFAGEVHALVDRLNGPAAARATAVLAEFRELVPPELRDRVYRSLVKALHPDAGGDAELMKALAATWGTR